MDHEYIKKVARLGRKAYRRLTSPLRPLPDFLILGTAKGGTESLFNQLLQHPQIVPPLKSSVHYFDENRHKSESWYRSHFSLVAREASKITGEKSPVYMFHPYAAERIHSLLPKVKMIVLLRDPVERAVSQYFHYQTRGLEPLSLMDALNAEETRLAPALNSIGRDTNICRNDPLKNFSYKHRGRYAEQLEVFFRHFPREQFAIFRSEDYFLQPEEHLRGIFAFLGLDATIAIQDTQPRNVGTRSDVPEEAYDLLRSYFKPHNERLKTLLGPGFDWGY